jgi:hypothetical protein
MASVLAGLGPGHSTIGSEPSTTTKAILINLYELDLRAAALPNSAPFDLTGSVGSRAPFAWASWTWALAESKPASGLTLAGPRGSWRLALPDSASGVTVPATRSCHLPVGLGRRAGPAAGSPAWVASTVLVGPGTCGPGPDTQAGSGALPAGPGDSDGAAVAPAVLLPWRAAAMLGSRAWSSSARCPAGRGRQRPTAPKVQG